MPTALHAFSLICAMLMATSRAITVHAQTHTDSLDSTQLSELSGLAPSYQHRGYYWAHNDSGDRPRLLLLKPGEQTLGIAPVSGANAHDWEDMASFSDASGSYLLVGDTGDNFARRPLIDIYLLREGGSITAPSALLLRRYSLVFDGGPRDVEGLAVDAQQRMVYLLSKREAHPQLYRFSLDALPDHNIVLTALGAVTSLPSKARHRPQREGRISLHSPTGLDFAADGRGAVISTPIESYYFHRQANQSWLAALNSEPSPLRAPVLRQVEAIAFSADGQAIVLGSEGRPTPLLRFNRPRPTRSPGKAAEK